jgi:hypothetical protein
MRYKEHTINKVSAQVMKLESIIRSIETSTVTGPDAVQFLRGIVNELKLVVERLELEPND